MEKEYKFMDKIKKKKKRVGPLQKKKFQISKTN